MSGVPQMRLEAREWELAGVPRVLRRLSARQAMYPRLRGRVAVIACIGVTRVARTGVHKSQGAATRSTRKWSRPGPSFARASAMVLDRETADFRVAASQGSPRDGAKGVTSLPGRLRRFFAATKMGSMPLRWIRGACKLRRAGRRERVSNGDRGTEMRNSA